MTHVGEAVELSTLVVTDHPVKQHPLGAVELLGGHGDLDVLVEHRAPWWREVVCRATGFFISGLTCDAV